MRMMRPTLILILLFLLTTTVASAGPPEPHIGPATVTHDPLCWIFDVDGIWYEIEDCNPTISIETNGKTEVKHWSARVQLPEGAALPEKGAYRVTYENSGFACWWAEGVETTNDSIVITPNGRFNISCDFRPDKWQPE